jgi:hypothetical protein
MQIWLSLNLDMIFYYLKLAILKKLLLIIFSFGILFLEAQNCWPATAQTSLDINNINAKLLNAGDIWWDGTLDAGYEYPNVGSSGTLPKHLMFAGALWMTANDANGNLKCAALMYRNGGHEFWPGPIVFGQSTIQDTTCTNFDRFFPIAKTDVETHILMIYAATGPLSLAAIPSNVLQWPGKGNQYLANTYGMQIVDDLAPFQDCNANGIYDPENGDYPLMKGDKSIFWVINDIGNTHMRSGGAALGVEIQCMAYAYATSDALDNATFYDYKVVKKTPGNLTDYYFSQFADVDLDNYSDDYIGCDTVLDYGFCYNADNNDEDYGAGPPIVITRFLKTPFDLGMTAFSYFNNNILEFQTFPEDADQFRKMQLGNWVDGVPFTCGNAGYGGIVPTKFVYPGNPAFSAGYTAGSCTGWSECAAGNTPGDRRYVMTSGPYDLSTSSPLEFTIAVMVAETDATTYAGCPDKISMINPIVNYVDSFIANQNNNPYNCVVLNSITDLDDTEGFIAIYPNPANDYIDIKAAKEFDMDNIMIYDALGSLVKSDIKGNRVDVSTYSKGVYTLKVYNAKYDKFVIKKFVLR